MGAWGVGLQANDTALDFIADLEDAAVATEAFEKVIERFEAEIESDEWRTSSRAILGCAEWLLDRDQDLSKYREVIDRCLKVEMGAGLEGWVDQDERRGALERFRKRLGGEPVDEKDLAVDNMGLMSRIATNNMSREEIKDQLVPTDRTDLGNQLETL
jgi:hypothetical protein